MTYTQGVGHLWIKKPLLPTRETIHRFPPSLRAFHTGGFSTINSFNINQLTKFYMKSAPTITTKL